MVIAYKLRVMLAHVRHAFDAHPGGVHPLQSIFAVMLEEPVPVTPPSDPRKHRRTERLGKRVHPFTCFRQPPDEDEMPEESATVVTRYFDGGQGAAKMLLSSGEMLDADTYVAGSAGFIVAQWTAAGESLELEVPNSCLDAESNTIAKWQHRVAVRRAPGRPKKRPAAAITRVKPSASSEGDPELQAALCDAGAAGSVIAGGEGSDDIWVCSSDGAAGAVLKARSAHGGSCTIAIVNNASSKDKAQILWVSKEMVNPLCKTPKQVCDEIIHKLGHEVDIKHPVAKNPGLAALKEKAQNLRAEMLDAKGE
jgi:hypothetical protein